jgi:hypothetical protein
MQYTDEQIQDMLKNAYRNFHRKGFDYICVERTDTLMKKVYFFDDAIKIGDDLVNPHDHRYPFETHVLAGAISNSFYREDEYGEVYNQFSWRTPLNGGKGFKWDKESRLLEVERQLMEAGQSYFMDTDQIHTIRVHRPGTVIVLDCGADVVPVDVPTRTYMHDKDAPRIDGLYDRFDADSLLARLRQYEELICKSELTKGNGAPRVWA